jgi:hypothetical protein
MISIMNFTVKEAIIFAEGSTPSRTRLYQMGITAHWPEIDEGFDLQGFRHEKWERFEKNRDYEAFLLRRKISQGESQKSRSFFKEAWGSEFYVPKKQVTLL